MFNYINIIFLPFFLSHFWKDEQKERMEKRGEDKENGGSNVGEKAGSVDFIQLAIPLILISNRLLDSRRTD